MPQVQDHVVNLGQKLITFKGGVLGREIEALDCQKKCGFVYLEIIFFFANHEEVKLVNVASLLWIQKLLAYINVRSRGN